MKKSSKLILQLVAVLVATLVGEFIMDKCFRIPVTLTSYCVGAMLWVVAGCCYLFPRYMSPLRGYRIIVSLILLGFLGVIRCLGALKLSFPVSTMAITAPVPALATFCIFGAIVSPPRKILTLAIILSSSTAIYFLVLWWSFRFQNDSMNLVLAQLIPFVAVAVALLITDNLNQGVDGVIDQPEGHKLGRLHLD